VIASYFTYFVIRPQARTNYGELIDPQRPIPEDLALVDPQGRRVSASSLKGQWLLVVVAGGACDAACEKKLWLQRQLREALGREKERVDKLWLVHDGVPPRAEPAQAVVAAGAANVLSVPAPALSAWLQPAAGHRLEDHFYIVDPLGHWMMRVPPDADAAKVKRDLEKLLRGSASWDQPGR
jgi:cytochrome oxidase Cu insertion factor (SCO1/SenC/PrrC family)